MHGDLHKQCGQAFGLGLDGRPLYAFHSHRQALDGLRNGLKQGERLLCLTGAAGSGKSAVCSALYDSVTVGYVGLITQPGLGDLLSRLKGRLKLKDADREPVSGQNLKACLLAAHKQNLPVIQLVDNADKLRRRDFIVLRRLLHLVGGQLVLAGTPELLSLFDIGGDKQRPAQPDQVFDLAPLDGTEIGEYIQHRLRQAGFDADLFSADAIAAVGRYSGGSPQLINMLCFMALTESCVTGLSCITADLIDDVARQRWESGIYPFHSAPPTAAVGPHAMPDAPSQMPADPTERAEQTDSEQFDSALAQLAADDVSDIDDTPPAEPAEPVNTANTADVLLNEPAEPITFTIPAPSKAAPSIPPLYTEGRQPPPVTSSTKPPARTTPRAIAGVTLMALAGLGLAFYTDTGLFDAGYQRLRVAATDKITQLACVDPESGSPASPMSLSPDGVAKLPGQVRNSPATIPDPAAVATDADTSADAPLPIAARLAELPATAAGGNPAAEPTPKAPSTPESQQPGPGTPDDSVALGVDAQPPSDHASTPAAFPVEAEYQQESGQSDVAAISEQQADEPDQHGSPAGAESPVATAQVDNDPSMSAESPSDSTALQNAPDPVVITDDTPALSPNTGSPPEITAANPQPRPAQDQASEPTEQTAVAQTKPTKKRAPAAPLTPAQRSYVANLYLERAEYEMRNQRYRDALISIGYGLETSPNHPVLSRMRSLVLQQINGQERADRAAH